MCTHCPAIHVGSLVRVRLQGFDFAFLLELGMSDVDSSQYNQKISVHEVLQELIEINEDTPVVIVQELKVELLRVARGFNVEQITNSREEAAKARRFVTTFMLAQSMCFFADVDEKQQAWMSSVAQEQGHNTVDLHFSVLYQAHKISYDYLKSMVNSAILWSQALEEADQKYYNLALT